MQLNEIIEKNSIRTISQKTNISEENLEALFGAEFDVLKKVKTMGFISIIEREYGADLSALREQAMDYYTLHQEEGGVVLDAPVLERKKEKPKLRFLVILILFGVASWYFITQFDREKLRDLLPFNEEKIVNEIKEAVDHNPDLSIEHAISQESEEKGIVVEASSIVSDEENSSIEHR